MLPFTNQLEIVMWAFIEDIATYLRWYFECKVFWSRCGGQKWNIYIRKFIPRSFIIRPTHHLFTIPEVIRNMELNIEKYRVGDRELKNAPNAECESIQTVVYSWKYKLKFVYTSVSIVYHSAWIEWTPGNVYERWMWLVNFRKYPIKSLRIFKHFSHLREARNIREKEH